MTEFPTLPVQPAGLGDSVGSKADAIQPGRERREPKRRNPAPRRDDGLETDPEEVHQLDVEV